MRIIPLRDAYQAAEALVDVASLASTIARGLASRQSLATSQVHQVQRSLHHNRELGVSRRHQWISFKGFHCAFFFLFFRDWCPSSENQALKTTLPSEFNKVLTLPRALHCPQSSHNCSNDVSGAPEDAVRGRRACTVERRRAPRKIASRDDISSHGTPDRRSKTLDPERLQREALVSSPPASGALAPLDLPGQAYSQAAP